MKATGIIRRIDDLGRVVIPKEVRRTLKIREGDPLEIFLDKDCVCFKKYEGHINYFTDIIAPVLKDAESEGLTITLYYDEVKIAGGKNMPMTVEEAAELGTVHGLGYVDGKEMQAVVRGCGSENALAKMYLRIIHRMALRAMEEG